MSDKPMECQEVIESLYVNSHQLREYMKEIDIAVASCLNEATRTHHALRRALMETAKIFQKRRGLVLDRIYQLESAAREVERLVKP